MDIFLFWFYISKLGSNTNGNVTTTPSNSVEGGVETTPPMTLEDVMKTLRMYMDIFEKFQWADQIALILQMMI